MSYRVHFGLFLLAGWPAVHRRICRGAVLVDFFDKTKYADDCDCNSEKSSSDARDQSGHVVWEAQETFVGLGTSTRFWKGKKKRLVKCSHNLSNTELSLNCLIFLYLLEISVTPLFSEFMIKPEHLLTKAFYLIGIKFFDVILPNVSNSGWN